MFELSVACKYLLPRRRQLSVSIISLISILVIALVVWLIVVFFSVTDGLEKSWVQKLTALTAPVRITPTEAYYHSYYYQIDALSESSHYSPKTIREKNESLTIDPYNPESDEEIPSEWPSPDRDKEGNVKDLVKLVYSSLNEIPNVPGLQGQDFELTATHIQLNLLRHTTLVHSHNVYGGSTQSSLAYPAYLGNFESENRQLSKTLLPINISDLNNLLSLIGFAPREEATERNEEGILDKLKVFFDSVTIQKLKTTGAGWIIPRRLLPAHAEWEVLALMNEQKIVRLLIPQQKTELLNLQHLLDEQGLTTQTGRMVIQEGVPSLYLGQGEEVQILPSLPFTLAGGASISVELDPDSLNRVKSVDYLLFKGEIPVQGNVLIGKIPYRGLEIAAAQIHSPKGDHLPLWIFPETFILPKDRHLGDGIILPKSFRDAGVLIGDRGSLSYFSPTASILQEQQIPVYVAGFYDPGIIPIGGKFILADREVTSIIRSAHQQEDKSMLTNGINVHFNALDQADQVKAQLLNALKEKGIARYWNVQTFREYEFTKEIMGELQSQKNLFLVIAVVIILVACSNIISMLIILVNDKKNEIGILRSMGASSKSIALIFGMAGAFIGVLGSAMGIGIAVLTLHHLDLIAALLSKLQGREMFSAHLYGEVLPHELSFEALSFVLISTVCISLLAGIVPAIKASLLRPSQILRSSGG